jgi:trimethylamine--corrinoid protein Co-methyltransferase
MTIEKSSKYQNKPFFRLLTTESIERIHDASIEVLSQTGVIIKSKETLDLLYSSGATIDNGETVKISRRMVEEALDSAPNSIAIFGRDGQPAMSLENRNVYFGTGPTIQFILDPLTGKRRCTDSKDIENATRIVDALPNLDFAMSMGMSGGIDPKSSGLDPRVTDRFDFAAMLKNTNKPLIFSNWSVEGVSDCYQMALLFRDCDEEKMKRTPFIMHYAEPTTPLLHDKEPLEIVSFCAEKSIPIIYVSGPVCGGTAPVTLAGSMILSNAECLSGIVISQLINKGAPVVYGGGISPMDMKTGVSYYGGPENMLSHIAVMEMADFYSLPDFNTGGISDAKVFDHQAAMEYTLSLFQAGLVGSNLVHDIGYLESGLGSSLEGIVFADEIIDIIKYFFNGITVDEKTMAIDMINKVGPGGNYLMEQHTFEHFRSLWHPRYLDRSIFDTWADNGSKELKHKLNDKVLDILDSHKTVALERGILSKIGNILEEATGKYPPS